MLFKSRTEKMTFIQQLTHTNPSLFSFQTGFPSAISFRSKSKAFFNSSLPIRPSAPRLRPPCKVSSPSVPALRRS
ncbi:hypothetical protein RchiOBHm_Chr6g0312481 [Rosa chinensis]|uniref:Uncharacterized protein n=1 Tax=Rosa chinensis TaxID=74649 RepID=A0A2P6Q1P0_ROSCH|nr:hypothetical protein RchiOBHm_Chr6g0312481 [Rosa chinensis]